MSIFRTLARPVASGREQVIQDLIEAGVAPAGENLDAWSAEKRDALRWDLVRWRDEGRVEAAENGLRLAARLWPDEPVFLLELLVLRQGRPSMDLSVELAGASEAALRYPEVALILGYCAAKAGRPEEAQRHFEAIGELPPERLAPFAGLYHELLLSAVLHDKKARYITAAAAVSDLTTTAEYRDLIESVAKVFVHVDRYGDLFNTVRAMMFFNILEVPRHEEIALAALEMARPQLGVEGKTIHLELVMATSGPERARALADELLDDPASESSARLARTISLLAARQRDGALERRALMRWISDAVTPNDLCGARMEEIRRRRRSLDMDRPLRVFVGLFGQLRDPEAVVPSAVSSIQAAFADRTHGEYEIWVGLSTWLKTGHRTLGLDDGAAFFAQAAPLKISHLFDSRHGANGRALATRFPALISTLLEYNQSRRSRTPTAEELNSYLPRGSNWTADPEEPVERKVTASLTSIGKNYPPVVNQFKMWSRIGALKQLLLDREASEGVSADICLLVRCDLDDIQGDLGALAARLVSPYERGTVFHDVDAHAEFIEGAGDRYIMCSRDASHILFSGFGHYMDAIADGENVLNHRISAHQGLQSLIFTHGLSPAPVATLNYRIHRSSTPTDLILPALRRDLDGCNEPDIRDAIESAIAILEREAEAVEEGLK